MFLLFESKLDDIGGATGQRSLLSNGRYGDALPVPDHQRSWSEAVGTGERTDKKISLIPHSKDHAGDIIIID